MKTVLDQIKCYLSNINHSKFQGRSTSLTGLRNQYTGYSFTLARVASPYQLWSSYPPFQHWECYLLVRFTISSYPFKSANHLKMVKSVLYTESHRLDIIPSTLLTGMFDDQANIAFWLFQITANRSKIRNFAFVFEEVFQAFFSIIQLSVFSTQNNFVSLLLNQRHSIVIFSMIYLFISFNKIFVLIALWGTLNLKFLH